MNNHFTAASSNTTAASDAVVAGQIRTGPTPAKRRRAAGRLSTLAAALLMLTTACTATGSESAAPEGVIVAESPIAIEDAGADSNDAGIQGESSTSTGSGAADAADANPAPNNKPASDDSAAPPPPEQFIAWGNCSAAEMPNPWADYVVGAESLNARLLPGVGEPVITALPGGTEVDIYSEPTDCTRLRNGSVWWFVNTPLLATGGYVHSSYVYDISLETDEGIGRDEENGFVVEDAQINCVYNGSEPACQNLRNIGYDESNNFGLGNTLSMAPTHALASDCMVWVWLACAELDTRGPGAASFQAMRTFINGYQAGDLAAQESVAGPWQSEWSTTAQAPSGTQDVLTGMDSMWGDGIHFGWTIAPTISIECIVVENLVQACEVFAD